MLPRAAFKALRSRGTSAPPRAFSSNIRSSSTPLGLENHAAFRTIRAHSTRSSAGQRRSTSRLWTQQRLLVPQRQALPTIQTRFASNRTGRPNPQARSTPASPEEDIEQDTDNSLPQGYQSKLRRGEGASQIPGDPAEEFKTPDGPTGPLPDLRQGIPSTFNPESSDKSSSFASKETEPPELNLTEDPTVGGGRQDEEGPRDEYVSSIERRRNAVARYMYIATGAFAVAAAIILGRSWESEAEERLHPEAPNGWSPMAVYKRIQERIGSQFGYYTEPAFPKLLPDPPADPALRAPYTLVVSLEDLLVTSKWDRKNGWTVAKRPGVDYFLRYLTNYFELVIFTTVQPMNAEQVLRKLDPFHFCLPLFRDATRYMAGEHVKDLSYLNRDLSKTIIIDTVQGHVKLQPENAVVLPKWKGDLNDPRASDLVGMIPFLEYIATMSIDDVRKVIKSYEGTHIPTEFARREKKAREEFNKRLAEEKSKRPKSGGGLGGISSALGFKPNQAIMQGPGGEQSVAEALAEGKMLSDQMRERGQRAYREMEKQIQENGEAWLKQQAEDEKKAQDEAAKNMTSGMTGWLPFFGGGNSSGEKDSKS